MEDGGLIWLASYPKSGNTWVRCLLEAYTNNGHVDINNIRLAFGDAGRALYQSVSALDVNNLTEAELCLLRPAALMFGMANFRPPRFVKSHSVNVTGDLFSPLIPPQLTKCAIYVVRDPRSVAVSWSRFFGKSMDDTILAIGSDGTRLGGNGAADSHVTTLVSSWSRHVASWSKKYNYPTLILRYEDMVEDTDKKLREIIEFLGWEYDEARAKRALKATNKRQLQKQEDKKGFQEASKHSDRFFTEGGTRWKQELAPKHIKQIEADHADMMKQYGYL